MIDEGLAPFVSYSYSVRAVDLSDNRSNLAEPISVQVGGEDAEPPTVPLNVVAVPIGGGQVDIAWDESFDNAGLMSYLIYRDGAFIAWRPAGTTTFSDLALTPGTVHNYTIRAVDINNLRSDQSLPATVVVE